MIKNRHLLTLLVKACTKFTNHHKTETSFHKLCLDLGCSFHSLKLTLDNTRKRSVRSLNYDNSKLHVLTIENCD